MPEPIDAEKIRIARLFATPVASLEHPDAERLNRALTETILKRAAEHPKVLHSNQGGWQSPDDFADWSGAAGAELLAFGQAFATQLSAVASPEHGLLEPKHTWTVGAWANVNRRSDHNAAHGHPGSYWSGVYWVDAGDGPAGAPDPGGELVFIDPRGVMPTLLAPRLRMRIEGCVSAGLDYTFRPTTGTFVMFPSWLLHSVARYDGVRPRISVAFNFSV